MATAADDVGISPGHRVGVAERARSAIRASGMSQREVATQMRLDETKLSKSLSGVRKFSAAEMLDLATRTGVTVTWLLGGDTSASVPPPEADRPRTHAATREQALRHRTIVESAWELFAARGFDAVRITDIARQAGVSDASVHYYFPRKADLHAAVLRYSVKLAYDQQVAWLSGLSDPRDRLSRLLELQSPIGPTARQEWSIWIQTWARSAVTSEPVNEEYVDSYRRWWGTVRAAIEDGQRQGVMRQGALDDLADEITSVLDGYGIKVLTGVMDVATMRRRIVGYLQRAVFVAGPDLEAASGAEPHHDEEPP